MTRSRTFRVVFVGLIVLAIFALIAYEDGIEFYRTGRDIPAWGTLENTYEPLVFSPDGNKLAGRAYLEDGIKIWDTSTKRLLAKSGGELPLAFGKAGVLTIAGIANGYELRDEESTTELPVPSGEMDLLSNAFLSHDGKTVVAIGSNVRVWSVTNREMIADLSDLAVPGAAISADGQTLALVGYPPSGPRTEAKSWRIPQQQTQASFELFCSFPCVAISQDGNKLAAGGGGLTSRAFGQRALFGEAKVWDLTAAQELTVIPHFSTYVISIAFSPDGQSVAISTSETVGGDYGRVELWDITKVSARRIAFLKGIRGTIRGLLFSPDGRLLAGADSDGVKLWNVSGTVLPASKRAEGVK